MGVLIIIVVVMYLLGVALMWEYLQETLPEECYDQPKVRTSLTIGWPIAIAASLLIHAYMVWDNREKK